MSADVVTDFREAAEEVLRQEFIRILERMQNKVLRGNLRPDGTREYETPVKILDACNVFRCWFS